MESVTANDVVAELNSANSHDAAVLIGCKIKQKIRSKSNSHYLAMDIYDRMEDKLMARCFMVGVIRG